MTRHAGVPKSYLVQAFAAAKEAGYEHVSVTVEDAAGRKVHISAGNAPEVASSDMTPLQKWQASRAP